MELIKTPASRLAEQVLAHYVRHPHLYENLLSAMGAQYIVPLRGELRCTCPIHGGDNPEGFALWYDKGYAIYKCFTKCADKGGLAKLVMRRYRCTYENAIVYLGRFAGLQVDGATIEVSRESLEDESMEAFKRRLGLQVAKVAEQPNIFPGAWQQYATATLYQPAGAVALDYLTGPTTARTYAGERKKQFPVSALQYFGIGFVPGNTWIWQDAKKRRDDGTPMTVGWYEDRVCFPWHDEQGRLIGFAGRRLDGVDHQKYKTLPGTKRQFAFWGLHKRAAQDMIRETRSVNLVEGYTDVIRGNIHGACNTLGVGGTELTEPQLDILKRIGVKLVTFYMDSDDAGQKSARRMAEQVVKFALVKNAVPPAGCDPDDLLDREAFWSPLLQATPFTPTSKERS